MQMSLHSDQTLSCSMNRKAPKVSSDPASPHFLSNGQRLGANVSRSRKTICLTELEFERHAFVASRHDLRRKDVRNAVGGG